MFKPLILSLFFTLSYLMPSHAAEPTAWDLFDWMEQSLKGEWVLSDPDQQIGTQSYKNPAVFPLIGTSTTATAYKLIGGDVVIQEDLLPNTKKQMVTMYHCKDIACTNLKATHYCSKQNQPEFLANLHESTPHKMIFECDMSTELCQSDEDHVHDIILELSDDNKHLKASYLSWQDKKPKSDSSIYYFDRK
ncbi:MAG: hypothetical protein PHO27_01755 [Sulfuricurvum sp.]|nr:hypothetical protein [Sulfuricurvum sp.]